MEQEENNGVDVGDQVWWRRGIDLRSSVFGVFTGKVRALRCEDPEYFYAVVATDPDGRLIQPRLDLLVKGMPPEPNKPSEEIPPSQEEESNDDSDVDLSMWDEASDVSQEEGE